MPSAASSSCLRATTAAVEPLPELITGEGVAAYAAYLRDESRKSGSAQVVAFPRTSGEVAAAVRYAVDRQLTITVSGARTGVAAGAVPAGGLLLSLERLNRIRGLRQTEGGEFLVRCEAGVLLAELQKAVRDHRFADSPAWDESSRDTLAAMKHKRLFFPPDPTETSASIGGVVAANASGAHTFLYGAARPYVEWLEIVLADGSLLELERGVHQAGPDGSFELQRADGTRVAGTVPLYRRPGTKNAAGYHSGAGMDLVDLFIGSEGTLGLITQAEVRLVHAPESSCAVVTFWQQDAAAIAFVRRLREQKRHLGIEAIEYFDTFALELLRQRRRELGASSGVPECLPADAVTAVYVDIGVAAARLLPVLQEVAALVSDCGGNPERDWTAMEKDERERLRLFRHALPETVNSRIAEIRKTHPTVTKLGTDMAVPDACLEEVLALYRAELAARGLEYVIFGHIGDNHLHVNILPRSPAEYQAGRELYAQFARDVVRMGGSPAAEHGIGKLKTAFLEILLGGEGLAQMRAVKAVFDPAFRLGPGTLFAEV